MTIRKAMALLLAGTMMASCGTKSGGQTASAGQKPTQGVGIVAHRGYWNCEEGGFARNSVAALKAAQKAAKAANSKDVNDAIDAYNDALDAYSNMLK